MTELQHSTKRREIIYQHKNISGINIWKMCSIILFNFQCLGVSVHNTLSVPIIFWVTIWCVTWKINLTYSLWDLICQPKWWLEHLEFHHSFWCCHKHYFTHSLKLETLKKHKHIIRMLCLFHWQYLNFISKGYVNKKKSLSFKLNSC